MFYLFLLLMIVHYKLRIKATTEVGGLDLRIFIFDEALKVQDSDCFYHKLMKNLVRRRTDWGFILLHYIQLGNIYTPLFCFMLASIFMRFCERNKLLIYSNLK